MFTIQFKHNNNTQLVKHLYKNTHRLNFRRWLFHYWHTQWRGSSLLYLISTLLVGFELLEPWPLKLLIDSVFGTTPLPVFLNGFKSTHQLIVLVSGSILIIYGMLSILTFIKLHFTSWLGLRLDYRLATDYFEQVERLSLDSFDEHATSDYVYRQNSEIGAVSGLLIDIPDSFFVSFLTVAGIAVVMLTINFQLSLIGFVIIPLLYVSIRLFSSKLERQAFNVEASNSKLYGYTTESIENLKLIQSFNKEKSRAHGLQSLLRFNIRLKLHYSLTDQGFTLTNDMLATGAMALLVVLGSAKVVSGHITVGDLLIFLTYLADLYMPLQSISETIGSSKVNVASSKRVFAIFSERSVVKQAEHPIVIERATGLLEFRDVSFRYGRTPILQNINLTIQPGERVAIIGHSGSGKSTFLSLLPRFYDNQQGLILLDGVDIKQLELAALRKQFAIVSQESAMLSTTVLNNLSFAFETGIAPEKELLTATSAANAQEFIARLPQGIHTKLTENGNNLSGGQKQRLAIARAFLKDAPVLLLDEPTSALDAESEKIVSNALVNLMVNRTTLVVSHNKGILENIDTIYTIEQGRLEQRIKKDDTHRFQSVLANLKAPS